MHNLKAYLCKGSGHGEAVTEGLLRESSKYPHLKKLQLIQNNPSLYTKEGLFLVKSKKPGLSIN